MRFGLKIEIQINHYKQDRVYKKSSLSYLAISFVSKEKLIELNNKLQDDDFEILSEPRETGDSYFERSVLDPNILEAIASILVGFLAGSIALVGFGFDSIIESLSGFVLIWHLLKNLKSSKEENKKNEKNAMKFVAITFFILAIYVLYELIKKLYLKEIPNPSFFGIIISIASLIIMPILGYLKYKTGKFLGSKALIADSKETFVCSLLSLSLLLGLCANYLFGFWQADPMAAIIIVIFLVKEGFELLEDEDKEGEDKG